MILPFLHRVEQPVIGLDGTDSQSIESRRLGSVVVDSDSEHHKAAAKQPQTHVLQTFGQVSGEKKVTIAPSSWFRAHPLPLSRLLPRDVATVATVVTLDGELTEIPDSLRLGLIDLPYLVSQNPLISCTVWSLRPATSRQGQKVHKEQDLMPPSGTGNTKRSHVIPRPSNRLLCLVNE